MYRNYLHQKDIAKHMISKVRFNHSSSAKFFFIGIKNPWEFRLSSFLGISNPNLYWQGCIFFFNLTSLVDDWGENDKHVSLLFNVSSQQPDTSLPRATLDQKCVLLFSPHFEICTRRLFKSSPIMAFHIAALVS